MSEILTSAAAGLGHVTLNRPEALHALTQPMCAGTIEALTAWRGDDAIRAVLIDHAPVTGGDIRRIAEKP